MTIIELMEQLLPGVEKDLVEVVQKKLKRLGVEIHTRSKVVESKIMNSSVKALVESENGSSFEVEADYAMVAVGKKATTENLGLEDVGIKLGKRGFVEVNEKLETNVSGIYLSLIHI